MINADDPYQFSMDESISGTPRTRSSNRKQNVKKQLNKQKEINSKSDQQDNSFMSNIQSGFSQFVNTKKRQRDEKKPKTTNKRAKGSYRFFV